MKRFHLIGAVALASVSMLLVSCGNSDPKPISEKAIVKEVNQKLVDDAKSELFAEVAVGTYECNDAVARQYLAKLEVAGLIEIRGIISHPNIEPGLRSIIPSILYFIPKHIAGISN